MTIAFTNFSCFHFHAMYQFARAAQDNELDLTREAEDRSFVLGAITSSVSFLEALVNEVFMLAIDGRAQYGDLPALSRRAMADLRDDVASKLSILSKYDLVLALSNCRSIDHGGQAYDDAHAVIQLRNAVVHYQIGFRNHPNPEPLKIEKRLKGKFPPSPYYRNQKGPLFPHRCLGAGCAVWAVKAARTYADEFHNALGMQGSYQLQQGVPTLI
jgi:hypothetical protein